MNRIHGYKIQTVVVMTLVLSCQLLTGTGLFCAGPSPHPPRALGKASTAFAMTAADREDNSTVTWNEADSQGKTVPCSCKKQKKCPAIPRVALTANPTNPNRLSADQRELRAQVSDFFLSGAMDHRFGLRCAPPYLELAGGAPLNSFTPLSITCVLLI